MQSRALRYISWNDRAFEETLMTAWSIPAAASFGLSSLQTNAQAFLGNYEKEKSMIAPFFLRFAKSVSEVSARP